MGLDLFDVHIYDRILDSQCYVNVSDNAWGKHATNNARNVAELVEYLKNRITEIDIQNRGPALNSKARETHVSTSSREKYMGTGLGFCGWMPFTFVSLKRSWFAQNVGAYTWSVTHGQGALMSFVFVWLLDVDKKGSFLTHR